MDTDFSLIRRMKRGEDEAFDIFVRAHYPDILKYCYYHCAESEDAQDLAQETFIRFFRNLSGYSHRGKAKNYLYTIAGNLCKDAYKKKREIPLEAIVEAEVVGDGEQQKEGLGDAVRATRRTLSEDGQERINDRLLIEQALDQLPEELREVIVLRYFQDLKLREIAALFQIGLPLVKYRLRRAKKILESLLGEEELL